MKTINTMSLILIILLSSIRFIQAKDIVQIYNNDRTSILILKSSNDFEILGYGGSIGEKADCIFFSKGYIDDNRLSGYLYNVDTSIISYNIEENKNHKFEALITKNTLDIKYSNVSNFCGIYTIFEGKYLKVSTNILKKEKQDFIDLLEGTEVQKNLLNILLTQRMNNLIQIEKILKQKKDLKTYNKEFFQNLLQEKPIEKKNLTTYNNIAYYLQKANANKEAVYLLEKILKKYPTRTVAHYNLADAYWALGEKKKAIASYTTYIEQMKANGKEKRIPKVVRARVSSK